MLHLSIYLVVQYGEADKQAYRLMPVFLGILPLLNALMDWISLNVTRVLTRKILHEENHGISILFWGLVDLVFAVFLVGAVTTLVLLGLATVNTLIGGSEPVLDLYDLMQGLGDANRIGEHAWIHFMVLSTLIPTLFHFGLVVYAGVMGWVMVWRKEHLEKFSDDYPDSREKVFEYVIARWVMVGVVSAALIGSIWWAIVTFENPLGYAGCTLWNWADTVLLEVDSTYYKTSPVSVCNVSS